MQLLLFFSHWLPIDLILLLESLASYDTESHPILNHALSIFIQGAKKDEALDITLPVNTLFNNSDILHTFLLCNGF